MGSRDAALPRRLPVAATFALLGVLLVAGALAGTAFGTTRIPLGQVLAALWNPAAPERIIVVGIRLPEVVAAALVGAALSLSGAVMQGVFRNPLADPGLLGISAGAGCFAVLALALHLGGAGLWTLPACAFVGALCAAAAIYGLGGQPGLGSGATLSLILAGVAVAALFSAVTTLLLTLGSLNTNIKAMLGWLFGGLDGTLWPQTIALVPFVAIGGLVMLLYARDLNLLATGEEGAAALGVEVESARRILLLLVALVTGAAVAVAGPVSFVGLMVPHMLRLLLGADHRTLLPASVIGGAGFVVLADLAARVVARPAVINLGVITAVLGVPFFLYLLRRAMGPA